MTKSSLRLIAGGVFLLVLNSAPVLAQPGPTGIDVPPVPEAVQVPTGHSAYLMAHALGTQNYICLATPSGMTWKFLGPQATLFVRIKKDTYQQVATHFLSVNPVDGEARPTWQHSFDTSATWAQMFGTSDDPAFVEAGAVPWLLLWVAGAAEGPAGGSFLAQATFIQRLNTSGGVKPAAPCSESTPVGKVEMVPYSADYVFYRAD